jgi:hypothetical protein
MLMTVNLTALPGAVRDKLKEVLTSENAAAMVQAKIRQQQAAKFVRDCQPRSMDGIGGMEMTIDPYWIAYFKCKYGTDPTVDRDFRRWLKAQGEDQFFVRHRGTRLQVAGAALPGSATRSFKKTYA